jgi:hypothetical protein
MWGLRDRQWGYPMRLWVGPVVFCTMCMTLCRAGEEVVPPIPTPPTPGWELGTWSVEDWGNPGTLETVAVGDQKVLKVTYRAGEKDKLALRQNLATAAAADGKVHVWVYAPEPKPPQVAVVLLTGKESEWQEAKPFVLKQGWNSYEVSLEKPNWKTKATQWKFEAGVANPESIQGVAFLVMNAKAAGWLALAGLTADPTAALRKLADLLEKLQDPDGEVRAKAEAELVALGKPALPALRKLKDSARPEVALRAGWAIDKIEGPKHAEETKKQGAAFRDARRRADGLLKNLQTSREKLQALAQEARDELERARAAAKDLKASEEELKAYQESLDQLDKLSQELQKAVGAPPAEGKK